jgi:hypothetical protein
MWSHPSFSEDQKGFYYAFWDRQNEGESVLFIEIVRNYFQINVSLNTIIAF